ncbi:MAG: SpaH/EbpB family LPXTG-anchored major pilin [Ruminococcus sp.]|nr:SpaH/EbpB family LPXTG-anchored major pilin [Ruminococcus sp.]
MKKYLVKTTSAFIIILTLIITAIPFASAATVLDETKKVSVTLNCSKPGYTFELFRVADLKTTSGTTNETAYTPLFDSIASEVKAGNSKNLLTKLDSLSPVNTAMPTGAVSCGTFASTTSTTTKTFSSLAQGIYYVKCTKYPAGVKSVTNSVFALPYFQNNSWVYTLSAINLANKVADDTPTTQKEITNSTKSNVNYTDVSLGDTVEFALYNTTAGSTSNKLEQYTVKDKMTKGLTFNKDSVKVYLADSSKTKIADLTKDTDYKLNVTSEGEGKDTEFNIALNKTYLAKSDFYASNVSYVIVTYSAVLNKYAVVGTTGNPNEDVELTYGNSSSVASVPGNTVYVYTYGVNVMKKNENGSALSGAKFSIYKTNANAQNNQSAIGSGTSDSNGKVTFLNSAGEEVKLQSGTYYIVETQAPSGYNVYGKVIPVTITATYRSAISNGTWVQNAPTNGTASVTVTDTKLIVPQTGGYVMYLYIAGAASLVLGGVMLFIIKRSKKNSK